LNKHEWELKDERCKKFHEASLIQPSSFDFATAKVMLAKKNSAGLWTEKNMCEDYKAFEPNYTSGQVPHAHP
jgi:hypothetical protein